VPASSALDICGALGVDGVVVGALSLDTYVMLEVEPGPHRVTIVTAESQHTLEVSADEGDNVFLEALPKMGLAQARAELRVLSPEQGRKRVLQERRVMNPSELPARKETSETP
jgi:hypothetical protein